MIGHSAFENPVDWVDHFVDCYDHLGTVVDSDCFVETVVVENSDVALGLIGIAAGLEIVETDYLAVGNYSPPRRINLLVEDTSALVVGDPSG